MFEEPKKNALEERVQRLIDAHLSKVADINTLDPAMVGRQVFLSLASSGDTVAHNSRLAYLELLGVPTADDIRNFCLVQTISQWASAPQGQFYRIKSG